MVDDPPEYFDPDPDELDDLFEELGIDAPPMPAAGDDTERKGLLDEEGEPGQPDEPGSLHWLLHRAQSDRRPFVFKIRGRRGGGRTSISALLPVQTPQLRPVQELRGLNLAIDLERLKPWTDGDGVRNYDNGPEPLRLRAILEQNLDTQSGFVVLPPVPVLAPRLTCPGASVYFVVDMVVTMVALITDLVTIQARVNRFRKRPQAILYWTGLRYPDSFEKIKMGRPACPRWYYASLEPSDRQRRLDQRTLERFLEERYPRWPNG